jgi:hypothetical protein
MAQGDSEDPWAFILCVEIERKKLSIDAEAAYYSFVHRLPLNARAKLEHMRSAKALIST